ncbi:MAG: 50S ribosome-binding GTPase, partial [Candidatus Eremiobacteraeota bacterium]|nr:50S ribosome-binding GTPase [Candidatus Eremiobacteraeota bacterium]
AAAMRRVERLIGLIDIIVEVIDARVPASGTSSVLSKIGGRRPRLVVLTREDLAEAQTTVKWLMYFERSGQRALAVNLKQRKSAKKIAAELHRLAAGKNSQRRAIVVGVPNSGKSTVINALCGRSVAATENRPGRTRGVQWFRLDPSLEVMDTPGILAPKIESARSQWMLAITGAIPAQRYDPEEVVAHFAAWQRRRGRKTDQFPDLEEFAQQRGMTANLHNAARSYIKALNEGAFGRISFEEPAHDGKAA